MTAALIRKIHVGCRLLGIDQDTRHQMQLEVVGKDSLSDMTELELLRVIGALEQRGFSAPTAQKHKAAPRADLRLIHVIWKKLGHAGVLETPTRNGLNAFIRRKFGASWGSVPADVDMLRDHKKIDAVLQALKSWARREQVELDWSRMGKRAGK